MRVNDLFRQADDAFREALIRAVAGELNRRRKSSGPQPAGVFLTLVSRLGARLDRKLRIPSRVLRAVEDLWSALESPKEPDQHQRTGRAADVARQTEQRRTSRLIPGAGVNVPMVGQVPADHPLVTGEMVPVESSNVHSIGYDLDRAMLYVRYLDDGVSAGPLYGYHDVTPSEFLQFLDAASKGRWVWDRLRERGTIAGYKKPYFLAGVTRGHIPRHAVLANIGGQLAEVFRPRQVMLNNRWRESQAPLKVVRVLQVVSAAMRSS